MPPRLLGDLVGVREMRLAEAPEMRRAQGELPGLNERALHGDGNEDAGLADVVVVEEIFGAGLEGVGVEQPAAEGNLHAELMLFVALAVQRDEAGVAWSAHTARAGPLMLVSGGG